MAGLGFIVAGWRVAGARTLVAGSIALFIVIELLTFLYIYPRLGILFGPDVASQSVGALRLAAEQFTTADHVRTVLMFVASAFSIAALFRFFKQRYAGA